MVGSNCYRPERCEVYGLAAHENTVYAGTSDGLWRFQDGEDQQLTDIGITHIDSFPGNPPIYVAGTVKGSFVWWKGDAKGRQGDLL